MYLISDKGIVRTTDNYIFQWDIYRCFDLLVIFSLRDFKQPKNKASSKRLYYVNASPSTQASSFGFSTIRAGDYAKIVVFFVFRAKKALFYLQKWCLGGKNEVMRRKNDTRKA